MTICPAPHRAVPESPARTPGPGERSLPPSAQDLPPSAQDLSPFAQDRRTMTRTCQAPGGLKHHQNPYEHRG